MTSHSTSRVLAATPPEIFAAFSDPQRLARWWGPAGFTNANHRCDFVPGGQWLLTMHAPTGTSFPNEYRFLEIEPPTTLVLEHLAVPRFRLRITLAPGPTGTIVSWVQTFEDAETARRLAPVVVPANEQNLDRLSAEVLRTKA